MKEPSLKEKVRNAILEGIFSGEYQPGDILNEKSLIESIRMQQIARPGSPDDPV